MNAKAVLATVVVAMGLTATACSSSAEPVAAPPTAVSTASPWSSQAVAACRAFANAVPNPGAARALVKNNEKDPTLTELRQAEADWADATGGMSTTAADLAVAAEKPVYDALSGVREAVAMRPGDNVYVSFHVKFFGDAFTICDDVLG